MSEQIKPIWAFYKKSKDTQPTLSILDEIGWNLTSLLGNEPFLPDKEIERILHCKNLINWLKYRFADEGKRRG